MLLLEGILRLLAWHFQSTAKVCHDRESHDLATDVSSRPASASSALSLSQVDLGTGGRGLVLLLRQLLLLLPLLLILRLLVLLRLLLLLLLRRLLLMMVMVVVMMMILPASKDLASLLVEIALLLDARQLDLQPLELVLQVTIRRLEVVALLQPLATAVLRVAAVLQGPSLLLQAHHLFPRATVEAFVQFANGKGHEELVVHEFFLGVAAGAARVQAVACPVRGAGPSGAARTH